MCSVMCLRMHRWWRFVCTLQVPAYRRHRNCPRKRKFPWQWNWLSTEKNYCPRGKEIGGTKKRGGERIGLVPHQIPMNIRSTFTCGYHPSELRNCEHSHLLKLQALVYDILPSTTAVFSYTIGPRKLSANEQFFAGAQTVESLLQATRIKQGVSFIAANKVYTSTNRTTIVWIKTELFYFIFYLGWMHLMFTCVLWR